MTVGADLFSQCVTAVSNQAESELERRGVTPQTADQWEQVTYAEDLLTDAGDVLYKVECRARDGGDWFQVQAVLDSDGTSVEIVVITRARAAA